MQQDPDKGQLEEPSNSISGGVNNPGAELTNSLTAQTEVDSLMDKLERKPRDYPDTLHQWKPDPLQVNRLWRDLESCHDLPLACTICGFQATALSWIAETGELVVTERLLKSTCRWPDPEFRSEDEPLSLPWIRPQTSQEG